MARIFTRSFWLASPLASRILAVNVGALMTLVLGMLYTGQYERGLIDSGTAALASEARLLGAALPAAGSGDARALLARAVAEDGTRVILFDRTGAVLHDSRAPGSEGEDEEPAPHGAALARHVAGRALGLLPVRTRLPVFPAGGADQGAKFHPGAAAALAGDSSTFAWRDAEGRLLLTAAVPVQGKKGGPAATRNAPAAALLLRPGREVDAAVLDAQLSVLTVFLIALFLTVLLSIYLSETIVEPLVRLAGAAEKMRRSLLMKDALPDLSWRRDEIGDLSRVLRDLTGELADRIDAISRFAADVAHEIKNPLASVKSAVETFSKVKDPEQQARLLAVIHDDVNRLNRLITDISNASRLDSELSRAAREPLDLAALVREVVEVARAEFDVRAELLLDLEEGRKLRVTGNATQLSQVFDNIIENALSFIPPGGRVRVAAALEGDKIIAHIDNDGPGIPENRLETVFERFYSERPRSEKFGMHSGLGLSISRQIVRTHRGEISAQNLKDESGNTRGVRFTVALPAAAGTQ